MELHPLATKMNLMKAGVQESGVITSLPCKYTELVMPPSLSSQYSV